jgi:23S rRNA pseudouridine1911/1915/1917 synthase
MATRILTVSRGEAGWTVQEWLRARLKLSPSAASGLLRSRKVRLAGTVCTNPAWRLRAGQRVEILASAPSAGGRKQPSGPRSSSGGRVPNPLIRFVDEHVVVVEKPSGLTTMRHAEDVAEHGTRARRFLPATLADLLPSLIAAHTAGPPGKVWAVHRLDKETSGLVVFARTKEAERRLGGQFRAHTTERLYLALVRGKAASARNESWLVRDRGDGRRGSSPPGPGTPPADAQRAVTHVRVVEALGPCTLVECRLETGRTHQVRIHLGEAGTPLCGERIYDRPLHGRPYPDVGGIDRMALHAATLGFDHPATGERVRWTSPLPRDMAALVEKLRKGGPAAS